MRFVALSSLIILWSVASSVEAAELKYTSFTPGTRDECMGVTENGDYYVDYSCDSLIMPQTWQKKIAKPGTQSDEPDYDLAIVGGGIGGAYLAYRLNQAFKSSGQELPKIALFERSERIGGRLVSAYGAGGLGLSVVPRNDDTSLDNYLPLQEYGGMRIDPYVYPLIWNTVIDVGKALFGDDKCLKVDEIKDGSVDTNPCPGMVIRMNVENVRFATTNDGLGPLLSNSTYATETTNSYCPADIAAGNGAPFDKCIQLAVAAKAYYDDTGATKPSTFKEGMETACANCDDGIEGFCNLCEQFPDPSAAVIACSGYDQPSDKTFDFIMHLVTEVIDVKRTTYLHLIRGGFQRFAQGLLQLGTSASVAPQFYREFTGISVDGVSDVSTLASEQINSISSSSDPGTDTVPDPATLKLSFVSGQTVTAKSAFLTMLPFDLPMNAGFEPWEDLLLQNAEAGLATKIVLGWNDASEAPPAKLGITPCVSATGCQRLIFSGDNEEGWMTRQYWMWDDSTIMIYTVGAESQGNVTYPADTLQTTAKDEGMDELIVKLMDELKEVTGVTVEYPDWARIQPWTLGNLVFWKNATIGEATGNALHRPLGPSVPVYYGNSEASPRGDLHGWAEGVLEMVENNLQSIATYLGLEGDVPPPDRSTGNFEFRDPCAESSVSGIDESEDTSTSEEDSTISANGDSISYEADDDASSRSLRQTSPELWNSQAFVTIVGLIFSAAGFILST